MKFVLIRNHVIVEILEHKVVVSGDSLLRKIHNRAVSAQRIVSRLKIIAGLTHHLPHSRRRDGRIPIVNIVAEIHGDRDVFGKNRMEIQGIRRRRSARLNGNDGCDMIRILSRRPARASALGMGHKDGILPDSLIYLIDGRRNRSRHHVIVKIRAHIRAHSRIRCHLTEKLIHGLRIIGELGTRFLLPESDITHLRDPHGRSAPRLSLPTDWKGQRFPPKSA